MDKVWFVFTLFMAILGLILVAAYIVIEINGIHMGIWNWIMAVSGSAMWIWFAYKEIKKRK